MGTPGKNQVHGPPMKPAALRKAAHRKAELREAPTRPSKLTLACADYAFPLLPHGKVLDLIRALEFDAVDIGLFEGRSHIWPSKVLGSPVKSGKQLQRQLAARGLRCADIFLQTDTSFVTYAPNNRKPRAAAAPVTGFSRHSITPPLAGQNTSPRFPVSGSKRKIREPPGAAAATRWLGVSGRRSNSA